MNYSRYLSEWEEWFLCVNMIQAFAAGVVNVAAVRRITSPWTKALYAAIAALAFGYSFAYSVLLFGNVPGSDWSSVMRGVSTIVWPVVWTGPALACIRAGSVVHQFTGAIREELKRSAGDP